MSGYNKYTDIPNRDFLRFVEDTRYLLRSWGLHEADIDVIIKTIMDKVDGYQFEEAPESCEVSDF